jgi:hypothetical protein
MRAKDPLRDHIMRNLKTAMDRVNPDIDRVEFWAAALEGLAQPVPCYEPGDSQYLLGAGARAQTGRTSPFSIAFPGRH